MDDTTLTMMSARNHEVIMNLPIDNTSYYNETLNYLRIYDYMHNVSDPEKGRSTIIRATKMQKAERGKEAALVSLKEAIGNSRIFINGQSVTDITNRDAASRIGAALAAWLTIFIISSLILMSQKMILILRECSKRNLSIL